MFQQSIFRHFPLHWQNRIVPYSFHSLQRYHFFPRCDEMGIPRVHLLRHATPHRLGAVLLREEWLWHWMAALWLMQKSNTTTHTCCCASSLKALLQMEEKFDSKTGRKKNGANTAERPWASQLFRLSSRLSDGWRSQQQFQHNGLELFCCLNGGF